MKKIIFGLSLLALFISPNILTASEIPEHLIGRVVIDVTANGEAWYINPQSQTRVLLGRPAEALERLVSQVHYENYLDIARIAPENGTADNNDSAYFEQQAGYILAPNDMIGAAWYIDPAKKVRRRLATADDAWKIMKDGLPVTSVDLKAIPIAGFDSPRFSRALVSEIVDADTIKLDDNRLIKLLSVSIPDNADLQAVAKARLNDLLVGNEVVLERDGQDVDLTVPAKRFVHLGEININLDLVRRGLAFDDVQFPNYRYAEQLIVGRLDAMRHSSGLWNTNK